jgi:hypothetical protein
VVLVKRPGGKEECVRTSRPATVAKSQSPEAFDHNGTVMNGLEQAVEFAVGSKRHDGAAPEVPHEQVAAVLSE